jgi:hypothetical protein
MGLRPRTEHNPQSPDSRFIFAGRPFGNRFVDARLKRVPLNGLPARFTQLSVNQEATLLH